MARNKKKRSRTTDLTRSQIKLATLEVARADFGVELARADALDTKLHQVAGFSGLSLAISGALGANVLVSGPFSQIWQIHIGIFLALAIVILASAVWISFTALKPANFEAISVDAAASRADRTSFQPSAELVERMISTYYLSMLPPARIENGKKARLLGRSYRAVELGFLSLAVSLVLTVIASVV